MPEKCPYCGVLIPANSLTCPKCYKTIQKNTAKTESYVINDEPAETGKKDRSKNIRTVKLLASVPALVGLLGLGHIYMDYKNARGYWFLIAGLLLFVTLNVLLFQAMDVGFVSAVFLLIGFAILALIYISAAIGAFLDAVFGSVFKILKF